MMDRARIAAVCFSIGLCCLLALAAASDGRTITFAGYRWGVKQGYWGPGPNLWSDSDQSVWVDEYGCLHLRIRQIDSTWHCAEVVSRAPAKYGTFRFYLVGQLDSLDINAVASPFLYAGVSTELDIEFSRWKDLGACRNVQYVVQPIEFTDKCLPSSSYEPFYMHQSGMHSTHSIHWQEDYVTFKSINGHCEEPPHPDSLAHERTFTRVENGDIPLEGASLRVHISLWLINGLDPYYDEDIEIVVTGAEVSLSEPTTSPSNVVATDDVCDMISVAWDWAGSCGIGFKVYRDGSPVFTGSDIDQRSWDDTDVDPGTSHTYYVAAYNATGTGPASNTDSGTRRHRSRNWWVRPDGTGDAPTIQAGIDSAASGDTVIVACGVFHEHNIVVKSGLTVTSETGEADCATIDGDSLGVIIICSGVDSTAVIRGLTLTGGLHDSLGGAMYCSASSPSITNCTFIANHCESHGGAVVCEDFSAPRFTGCVFSGNSTSDDSSSSECKGGGLYSFYSAPTLTNCTFSCNTALGGGGMYCGRSMATLTGCKFEGNTAREGGAVLSTLHGSIVVSNCTFTANSAGLAGGGICHWYTTGSATILGCDFVGNSATLGGGALAAGACTLTVSRCTFASNSAVVGGAVAYECNTGTLEQTVIAFNSAGGAVACQGGNSPTLSCCDVYGNVGGDWVGCISDQYGTNGNFSADPLFCDPDNDDYHLLEDSPCGPEQQPVCGLTGALEVGCYADTPVWEDEVPGKQPHLTIGPNPFETASLILYEIPGEYGTLPVALKIYDATGRHVRTLFEGPQHVGRHVTVWHGLDSEGDVLPPGIYFCRLSAGEGMVIRKLVRLK